MCKVQSSPTRAHATLSASSPNNNGQLLLELQVASPDQPRAPHHMSCVIDTSGSMGTEAVIQNASGETERHGLSYLDVVKHATRTTIEMLEASDSLSLVAFNTEATVVLPPTQMTPAGKRQAIGTLMQLQPGGRTNMWDGIRKALAMMEELPDPIYSHSILLLTDGVPNIAPARGTLGALEDYLTAHPAARRAALSSFGFGYQLESQLLVDLATVGGGGFGFIPDSGFVGTTFIHAVAGALTLQPAPVDVTIVEVSAAQCWCAAAARDLASSQEAELLALFNRLDVTGAGEVNLQELTTVLGDNTMAEHQLLLCQIINLMNQHGAGAINREQWMGCLTMHDRRVVAKTTKRMHVGQTSVTALPVQPPTDTTPNHKAVTMSRSYQAIIQQDGHTQCIELMMDAQQLDQCNGYLSTEARRIEMATTLWGAIADAERGGGCNPAAASIRLRSLEQLLLQNADQADGLLEELRGQVSEAFSRADWYGKWGKHYIRALAMAHDRRQCTNFKDPGIQRYAEGDVYNEIRDAGDELFLKLPPPTPSIVSRAVRPPAPVNMSSYHNCNNSCFRGDGQVSMADGSLKAVDQIQKADLVMTARGTARVKCVVKTRCEGGSMEMVKLPGGLVVTCWHPVKDAFEWKFPGQLAGAIHSKAMECIAVYSFVLEDCQESMTISGVECVCLGHGILQDRVASHAFFGTQRVIEALKTMPGWSNGKVEFLHGCTVRDSVSELVIGFARERALPTNSQ